RRARSIALDADAHRILDGLVSTARRRDDLAVRVGLDPQAAAATRRPTVTDGAPGTATAGGVTRPRTSGAAPGALPLGRRRGRRPLDGPARRHSAALPRASGAAVKGRPGYLGG